MKPFTTLSAVAAPIIRDNVDTDAIIPSREMRSVSKSGLADGLFAGWRYLTIGGRDPNPSFVLNRADYRGTEILLGGENFGCGSSREHAAWALAEYGIRAIVAPSFNPIFQGNCVRNGILPVRLPPECIAQLANSVAPDPQKLKIGISLHDQRLRGPDGSEYNFDLQDEAREMLLSGHDAIDLTLAAKSEIDRFIAGDRTKRAWAYCVERDAA